MDAPAVDQSLSALPAADARHGAHAARGPLVEAPEIPSGLFVISAGWWALMLYAALMGLLS